MKNNIYSTVIVFALIFIYSCNYITNKKQCDKEISSETILSKTISFPNSLFKLEDNKFEDIDAFLPGIENKSKIISIVDGICMKCIIYQLNVIDSIFNSITATDDNLMIFILNVSRDDSAYFMRNLQPAIKAKGIILWDDNYNFERQNDLFTSDINLRTFMTNKENKIIQVGNPVRNPDVIKEYQQKLAEL